MFTEMTSSDEAIVTTIRYKQKVTSDFQQLKNGPGFYGQHVKHVIKLERVTH